MSAVRLKLTLGNFEDSQPGLAEELRALLKAYAIHLTIENDEKLPKGSPAVLMAFIAEARKASLDIGLTFDTVNFVYIDTDPFDAAKEMRKPWPISISRTLPKRTKGLFYPVWNPG